MNYILNLGHAHKLKFGLFAIARSDFLLFLLFRKKLGVNYVQSLKLRP